jgi:hypothetical protein
MIATAPAGIDIGSLFSELDVGWTAADMAALEAELRPWTAAMLRHLASGERIASHVRGASSLCVPITDVTDPGELYATAAGEVSGESYEVRSYDGYWVTTHVSTVPVVILLLKDRQGPLPVLDDLCARCARALGRPMGETRYFQWNQPGFGWTLHTDDDYEGVDTRVHLPVVTTPENYFAWAATLDAPREEWLLTTHLERGKVYRTRVDVPHTAFNEHPTDGRLHLILDVAAAAADGWVSP